MFCCSKKKKYISKKKVIIKKKNIIHPTTNEIKCCHCSTFYPTDEIKAHCNICEGFFHL